MSFDQPDKKTSAEPETAKAALASERGPGEKEAFSLRLLLYANPT